MNSNKPIASQNKILFYNILSTILLQGISFFTSPIFSRMLGTANYGIISVYATWASVCSIVFTLQAGSTLVNARNFFPMENQEKYQSSVLALSIFAYGCCSFLTMIVTSLLRYVFSFDIDVLMVACILVHGAGSYCIQFFNLKYTYEFRADKNLALSLATAITNIGLSLILVPIFPKSLNYWGRIIALIIVNAGFGTAIFLSVIKKGRVLFNKEYWSFTLAISIPTIFHLMSSVILTQSDRVMMKYLVNNESVGIYSLAANFAGVMTIIWQALNNSWIPFYYEYTRKKQIDIMLKHAKNYIILFTVLTSGFILLTPEVYHIFAPEEYWEGTNVVILLTLGAYFSFLYGFPANYLFYNRKTKLIAAGSMVSAVINMILNIILIGKYQIYGAVIATMICYAIQFLIQYIGARRIGSSDFPFRMRMFVVGFVVVVCMLVLSVNYKVTAIARWGIAFVMGIYMVANILRRKSIF